MLARPENIDALALHLQLQNLDRARLKTHEIARTDALRRALPHIQAPLKGIWGALDPFALPDMAARESLLRQLDPARSEEHTSELQSLMRISYAVFCLKKKTIPELSC